MLELLLNFDPRICVLSSLEEKRLGHLGATLLAGEAALCA